MEGMWKGESGGVERVVWNWEGGGGSVEGGIWKGVPLLAESIRNE